MALVGALFYEVHVLVSFSNKFPKYSAYLCCRAQVAIAVARGDGSTDRELCDATNLDRETLRFALAELKREGIVFRRGLETFLVQGLPSVEEVENFYGQNQNDGLYGGGDAGAFAACAVENAERDVETGVCGHGETRIHMGARAVQDAVSEDQEGWIQALF